LAAQSDNRIEDRTARPILRRWGRRERIYASRLNQAVDALDAHLRGVAPPRVLGQAERNASDAEGRSDQIRLVVLIGPFGCNEHGEYNPVALQSNALRIRQISHKPPVEEGGSWSGIWLLSGEFETVYCWPGMKAGEYKPLFYPREINADPCQNEEITNNVPIVPVIWFDGRWCAVQQIPWALGTPDASVPHGDCVT